MTKIQLIRQFVKELAGEKVVVRPETFWGACGNKTVLVDVTALTPVPDIDMLQDDNAFRTNFLRQGGKQNREFSNIVLILLHEIGHLHTNEQFDLMEYHSQVDGADTDEQYFSIPAEYAATQWAIDWLKVPTNREKAKALERAIWWAR